MKTSRHRDIKRKTETQVIFLQLVNFAIVQTEFVVCLFVDKVKNGSCPIAKGLNGVAHLWNMHIVCKYDTVHCKERVELALVQR